MSTIWRTRDKSARKISARALAGIERIFYGGTTRHRYSTTVPVAGDNDFREPLFRNRIDVRFGLVWLA